MHIPKTHWPTSYTKVYMCVEANSFVIAGTDVDQRDSAGLTPLLWSAANGQRSAYELLLQYGTSFMHDILQF